MLFLKLNAGHEAVSNKSMADIFVPFVFFVDSS